MTLPNYTTQRIYALLLLILVSSGGFAQKKKKHLFRDTTDHAIDMSGFLNSVAGFMPVPFVITEPAVGYGGGLGLVFFHDKKNNRRTGPGHLPPIMTMVGGGYTANGTYVALVGHQGSYHKDRFRYTGALGFVNVNIAFYGAGILVEERAYDFNMQGWVTFHEFLFRPAKKTPFFVGLNYVYFNNDITFKTGLENPKLAELQKTTNTAGLNAVFQYDTRDNSFTPSNGFKAVLEVGRHAKALGGDRDYNHVMISAFGFTNAIHKRVVAGLRLKGQGKWDDVPFYELPFVSLRGIPVMRYQDHFVGVMETEWRWNVWRRWSVVGFTGVGYTAPTIDTFKLDTGKVSYGGGFRYFMAREFGIHGGIDVAKGPEEWAWYITIGSNWVR